MKTNQSGVTASSKRRKAPKPVDIRPHVAVAPGLLDAEHTVIRQADDTDAEYDNRRRLLEVALDFARKG
jgi:hypothetical protein